MLLFGGIFYYLSYINFTVYFDFIVYYLNNIFIYYILYIINNIIFKLNIFAIIEHETCKNQNEVYKMLFLNVYTKILYKMFSSYPCFPCCYVKSENDWKKIYFNSSRISPRITLVISKSEEISFWKYRKIYFLLLNKVQVFHRLRIFTSLVFIFYQTVKITVLAVKNCCQRHIKQNKNLNK